MNEQSTEKPWRIEISGAGDWGIYKQEEKYKKVCGSCDCGQPSKVNGDFIIQAVNSYDALKRVNAELSDMIQKLEYDSDHSYMSCSRRGCKMVCLWCDAVDLAQREIK